jgi:RNA polymerase sigma-70 factor (ECF subfamily)
LIATNKSPGPGDERELLALEPALRRFFRRRAPSGDIDDLVQEVFVSLKARRAEAPIQHIDRYLFTVAAAVLSRRYRLESRSRLGDETDDPEQEPSPERVLIGRERLQRAMDVIANLPQRTREVFVLHRFEEMSYQRIGAELGISVSAVEKHIMLALRALTAGVGRE